MRRQNSSRRMVPTTLVVSYSSGRSIDGRTPASAARWTTASKVRSGNAPLRMSQTWNATPSGSGSFGGMWSRPVTQCPAVWRCRTTWVPMKPEEPVTRTESGLVSVPRAGRQPAPDCAGRSGHCALTTYSSSGTAETSPSSSICSGYTTGGCSRANATRCRIHC